MSAVMLLSQMACATSYAVLVVLPCLLIALIEQLPRSAVVGTFLAYAFALFPTYHLDHWLFGGVGFHSPTIFALMAGVVAATLWPLPLLSVAPTVWRSALWRRVIFGYGAVLIAFATLAAWQMTRSWNLFFG